MLISIRFAVSIFSSYMKQKARSNYVPPLVSVEEVKQENVIQSFEAPGRVVSKYQVSIMARVSGYLQKVILKKVTMLKQEKPYFSLNQMSIKMRQILLVQIFKILKLS